MNLLGILNIQLVFFCIYTWQNSKILKKNVIFCKLLVKLTKLLGKSFIIYWRTCYFMLILL
jgi:hypothetical protein